MSNSEIRKLATIVKRLRGKAGFTKGALAMRSGLSRQTIEKIEAARHVAISIVTLTKIATGLNCSIDDLGYDISKCI